jgi:pimeloyl-ACP methyl ester carboxylesterase
MKPVYRVYTSYTSAVLAMTLIACAGAKPVPESVNGLRFVDEGSGGVPVVFLHGLCGEKEVWRAQLEHLKSGRRVVAYDQRGHGASQRAPGYSIDLLADDLDDVARELRLGKFWLVGHSMSGAVLSAYAGKHPERLAGLVFVDAVGDFSGAPPEVRKWFEDPGPGFGAPQVSSALAGMLGPLARQQTHDAVVASAAHCDPRAFVQLRQELIARSPAPGVAKFDGPKAAIEAEGPDNPYLASKLPGVRRIELKGVSHWLMLDDPAGTNHALDEALQWTK